MAQALETPRISAARLHEKLQSGENVAVVDVRRGSWDESDVKIPGAIRIDPERYRSELDGIPQDADLVVTYCT